MIEKELVDAVKNIDYDTNFHCRITRDNLRKLKVIAAREKVDFYVLINIILIGFIEKEL